MKAAISVSLKTASAEKAKKMLEDLVAKLRLEGKMDDYSFEIKTNSGVVTEKCVLSDGKVVA